MNLHNLEYTKGSKTKKTRVGRGTSSGKGKTSTRVWKDKIAEVVEELDLALKADKLHYIAEFLNLDLHPLIVNNIQSLTYQTLIN